MTDQKNGHREDIQTRIAFAGDLVYGTAEWDELMPTVAHLLEIPLDELVDAGDRFIALVQVAKLAGCASGTAIQWRQRTRRGELTGDKAFPQPDDEKTFKDKPMWRLSTILRFLLRSKKWPLGAAGRPLERKDREPAREATARVAAELAR